MFCDVFEALLYSYNIVRAMLQRRRAGTIIPSCTTCHKHHTRLPTAPFLHLIVRLPHFNNNGLLSQSSDSFIRPVLRSQIKHVPQRKFIIQRSEHCFNFELSHAKSSHVLNKKKRAQASSHLNGPARCMFWVLVGFVGLMRGGGCGWMDVDVDGDVVVRTQMILDE